MFYTLVKFIFREVIVNNLLSAPVTFFQKEIEAAKAYCSKAIADFMIKLLVGLFLLSLLIIGCLFAFLALAIYLNEVFYSPYKGFLLVASGCIVLAMLAFVFFYWRDKDK